MMPREINLLLSRLLVRFAEYLEIEELARNDVEIAEAWTSGLSSMNVEDLRQVRGWINAELRRRQGPRAEDLLPFRPSPEERGE